MDDKTLALKIRAYHAAIETEKRCADTKKNIMREIKQEAYDRGMRLGGDKAVIAGRYGLGLRKPSVIEKVDEERLKREDRDTYSRCCNLFNKQKLKEDYPNLYNKYMIKVDVTDPLDTFSLNISPLPVSSPRQNNGLNFSPVDIAEALIRYQTVSFSGSVAYYQISIKKESEKNGGGFVLTKVPDSGTKKDLPSFAGKMDCTEWSKDETKERYFAEAETLKNPEFLAMCEEIAEQVNQWIGRR